MRIIQYNLVYVIGLPSQLTDERILSKSELFGKYGTIRKIIVCDSRQSTHHGKLSLVKPLISLDFSIQESSFPS